MLEIADLRGDPFQGSAGDGDSGNEGGVAVPLDDLRGNRVAMKTEVGEDFGLEVRVQVAVGTDRPRDLARGRAVRGNRQAGNDGKQA